MEHLYAIPVYIPHEREYPKILFTWAKDPNKAISHIMLNVPTNARIGHPREQENAQSSHRP